MLTVDTVVCNMEILMQVWTVSCLVTWYVKHRVEGFAHGVKASLVTKKLVQFISSSAANQHDLFHLCICWTSCAPCALHVFAPLVSWIGCKNNLNLGGQYIRQQRNHNQHNMHPECDKSLVAGV